MSIAGEAGECMTAEAIVYAIGAGSGHSVRGSVIAANLAACGYRVRVLIRPVESTSLRRIPPFGGGIEYIEASAERAAAELRIGGPLLVVDTFPFGWSFEIGRELLQRFSKRLLVARYNRELNWDHAATLYTNLVAPYSPTHDEWETPPQALTRCGLLLRGGTQEWESSGEDVLVIDPEQRLNAGIFRKLVAAAGRAGRRLRYQTNFESSNRAGKFLFVGAGYNSFYEALRRPIDAQFIAVDKRYDDQHARASRCGRRIGAFSEFNRWVSADVRPASAVTEQDCCAGLQEYLV